MSPYLEFFLLFVLAPLAAVKLWDFLLSDPWLDISVRLHLERDAWARQRVLRGSSGGVEVVLTGGPHGQLEGSTIALESTPPVSQALALVPKEAHAGSEELDFDRALRLAGPPDLVAAALSEHARKLFGRLLMRVRLEVGDARVLVRIGKTVRGADAVVAVAEDAIELCRELSLAGESVAKRLADNAAIDSDREVRALNLRLLLEHHPESNEAVRASADRGVEALLLELLESSTHRPWAIEELARVGTVRALPGLHALLGGMLVDAATKDAARRAVKTIEARLPDAEAGDLSLAPAEGPAGELSLAEDGRGELSLGGDDE